MDYKKAYLALFNGVSDTIDFLGEDNIRTARSMLMMAQRRAEMLIISQPSEEDEVPEETAEENAPPQ
ncbi:MAG: hypothetical protein HFG10_07275 [Oscillibacter sp.]|jgi:hypothetical protein|nr:hypothetical protein [Oscillibacter sp.]